MPPRFITLGILLFWCSMTTWLMMREVVPMLLADDSPTVEVDLTIEIGGSPSVGWIVEKDGTRIGGGTSRIVYDRETDTYEFRSAFHYEKFGIGPAKITQLDSMYRVTKEGELKALS